MKQSIHFYVSGRVQGVFFRMHTRQQAHQYQLTGWVRNLPDGRVEGVASGDETGLKAFRAWLQYGPDLARVTDVEVEELDYTAYDGFTVR